MKNVFNEMPRAIKVIFIIYILIFFQTASNFIRSQTPTYFYLLGFLVSGAYFNLFQLIYSLIYFVNLTVIYKRIQWGYKFIILSELFTFTQGILFTWKNYSNSNLDSVKLVYVSSAIFATLLTSLFIYYIYKNRDYFVS